MATDFSHSMLTRGRTALRWGRPGMLLLAMVWSGAAGCKARGPVEVDRDKSALPVQEPSISQVKIQATNPGAAQFFGQSVALSDGTAVVGASRPADLSGPPGAYVFERSGPTWTQETVLTAGGGTLDDGFALSVAVSGATAVVGANRRQVGANRAQGAAYVFVRSGTTWTQEAMLIATDGAADDGFGDSVAVSGDTAVIGATGRDAMRGAAYVFERSGTTWAQKPPLSARDGAAGDGFGFSVAVSGGTALVGANRHIVGGNRGQGAAYVFTRGDTTWAERDRLVASDGKAFSLFGSATALSGTTAVVGAYAHQVGSNDGQGAAYVFVSNGQSWTPQPPLIASDGRVDDLFGQSVATNGTTVVIGAHNRMVGDHRGQGVAYVFTPAGSGWTQQAVVTSSDGQGDAPLGLGGLGGLDGCWPVGDNLGWSGAMSGDTFILGARYHAHNANHVGAVGAAYLFTLPAAARKAAAMPSR
jgi:hypothetical protein